MKRRILFSILIFIVLGCSLWAEKLRVEYLEGTLEAKEGKNWVELFTDDLIDSNSVVRLSPESLVELSGGKTIITLMKPGIYNLADILKQARNSDSYGFDSMVTMKLKAIIDETAEDGQETNMGVRANAVEDYIDDDVIQELFDLADEEMKKENYDKAIRLFKDAIDAVEITDPGADSMHMFYYYIGYCHSQKGEDTKALSYLIKIDVDTEAPYYADYVLLYGKLLIKSFAYSDAIILFTDYISKNKNNKSPILQDVYYLVSICYINLETIPEALIHLKKAEDLAPGSEVGRKARDIINKLEKS